MTDTATKSGVSEELSKEIEESVDAVIAEDGIKDEVADTGDDKNKKPGDEAKVEDIPSEEEADDEASSDEVLDDDEKKVDDAGGDDKDAVTDELIERAIVSKHYSMSEAKAFPNATFLKSVLDKLDAQSKKDGGGDGAESNEEKADPLSDIPDIKLDPEVEYDESVDALAKGFNSMKEIIRKQSEEIDALKTVGTKNVTRTFVDSKMAGLDKDYAKALKSDLKKGDELRKQYDVLVAGHEAVGSEFSQDEIFDQAVSVVLGSVKTTVTEKKLRARKGQQISRPGGEKTEAKGDPFDEVADNLDRKYFDKK